MAALAAVGYEEKAEMGPVARLHQMEAILEDKCEFKESEGPKDGNTVTYGISVKLGKITAKATDSSKKTARKLAATKWIESFEKKSGGIEAYISEIKRQRRKAKKEAAT